MGDEGDIDWSEYGVPRSRRYGDVYFSREDGLAESRAVFLDGCGLPEAWAGRDRFTVAELGFGTGLNMLALLRRWSRARHGTARLHLMSVEAHPLTPEQARRALSHWPTLADLAAPLLDRWPRAAGVTRIDWPALGVTLDVIVAEVETALRGWDGAADAWFLDGFSPARNPEMWRSEVLALVAARSAPGARLASFTVAGAVRRGLEENGFRVVRRPGFGAKRQRLEARFAGEASPVGATEGDVAVIGGGIAGAAVARALRMEGLRTVVVTDDAPGASGNPAALVTPRLTSAATAATRFSAQAFRRAVALYADEPGVVLERGVRRLGGAEADWAEVIGSPLFAPGAMAMEPAGLWLSEALVIRPARLIEAWTAGVERVAARVAALRGEDDGWRLLDGGGRTLLRAATVVLAAGWGAAALRPTLGLRAVRGQVSWAPGVRSPAAEWGGYCAGAPEGLLFGATHDRGDEGVEVRPGDHERNLARLAEGRPDLAASLDGAALGGRAAVRAATPDHLPLAGPAPGEAGLWILEGLGGRGFSTAPLLAEHLAATIAGAPSPLPRDLADAVSPGRFAARDSAKAARRARLRGALPID